MVHALYATGDVSGKEHHGTTCACLKPASHRLPVQVEKQARMQPPNILAWATVIRVPLLPFLQGNEAEDLFLGLGYAMYFCCLAARVYRAAVSSAQP